MAKSLPHNLIEIRRDWAVLSAYERFEAFVALTLTLLIAARERGIIQARIVILIAVLALVRKIIVTDLSAIAPGALAAEAALILALGVTYWLMRERDDRWRRARRPGRGADIRGEAS